MTKSRSRWILLFNETGYDLDWEVYSLPFDTFEKAKALFDRRKGSYNYGNLRIVKFVSNSDR